jgi:hypothetical protein
MKAFKTIDIVAQALLLLFMMYAILFRSNNLLGGNSSSMWFFGSYFMLGGWQLLSCVVHLAWPAYRRLKARIVYYVILGIILLATLLSFFVGDALIVVLLGCMFITPVVALFYFIMCIMELSKMKPQIAA